MKKAEQGDLFLHRYQQAKKAKEPLRELEYSEMIEILDHLTHLALSYDDWIKVGSGIKGWSNGNEGAYLFHRFSCTAPKYDEKATSRKWAELKPLSVGLVINEARAAGWTRKPSKSLPPLASPLPPSPPQKPTQTPQEAKKQADQDQWRARTFETLQQSAKSALAAKGRTVGIYDPTIIGYMRGRGIPMQPHATKGLYFLGIFGVSQLPISKDKRFHPAIIAEIRHYSGDLRGYHVVFLESKGYRMTYADYKARKSREISEEDFAKLYSKSLYTKSQVSEPKRSYKHPKKTLSGAGVWIDGLIRYDYTDSGFTEKQEIFRLAKPRRIAICEGIETGIALRRMAQIQINKKHKGEEIDPKFDLTFFYADAETSRPSLYIVAALSAVNLDSLDVPPDTEEIHLFPDIEPSKTGIKRAAAAAIRHQREGRQVTVHLPPNAGDRESWDWHNEAALYIANLLDAHKASKGGLR